MKLDCENIIVTLVLLAQTKPNPVDLTDKVHAVV